MVGCVGSGLRPRNSCGCRLFSAPRAGRRFRRKQYPKSYNDFRIWLLGEWRCPSRDFQPDLSRQNGVQQDMTHRQTARSASLNVRNFFAIANNRCLPPVRTSATQKDARPAKIRRKQRLSGTQGALRDSAALMQVLQAKPASRFPRSVRNPEPPLGTSLQSRGMAVSPGLRCGLIPLAGDTARKLRPPFGFQCSKSQEPFVLF